MSLQQSACGVSQLVFTGFSPSQTISQAAYKSGVLGLMFLASFGMQLH